MYDALADALGPSENDGHQDGVQAICTLAAQRDAALERITDLETLVVVVRDALEAAAYVCDGVAEAPSRPETVAPGHARATEGLVMSIGDATDDADEIYDNGSGPFCLRHCQPVYECEETCARCEHRCQDHDRAAVRSAKRSRDGGPA